MNLRPPASSPQPRWTRKLWPKLLLLAGALVVGLGLAETAYRIYTNAKYSYQRAHYTHKFWQLVDGPEVYRMRPGARGFNRLAEDSPTTWTYAINAQDFRGRTLSSKRPGVRRIIFLGDSYAFGWGLSEGQPPFPAVVERILNSDAPTTRAEVMNAAVPGYNTRQQCDLLADLIPRYRPDAVVLTYVMNDAEPMAGSLNIPIPPRLLYAHCRLWLPERVGEILNARIFGPLLGRPFFFTIHKSYHDFAYLKGFAPGSPKWRDARAALADAAALCRRRGIPLLLVILPDFFFPFDRNYPYASIDETVRGWGRDLKIPTLDLLPDFMGTPPGRYRLADGHPNAPAHEKIGKAIA
ncbi:MAG: SGNH/GDSL hydrolase family protein, partial [bacterium]|nr:SGNH/GDSL hydrolase family protein [bacterium]